ncbi:MAG: catalase [Firmicutes bacterium]|nr:catalase [Bacillota bacterium]
MMIKGFFGHFQTVARHRRLVRRNCFRCGIPFQGLTHDLSKYAPTEFLKGARYYQGTQSPNNAERKDTGVSLAWLHHKGRNKHHYEYWTDYVFPEGAARPDYGPVRMPNRYILEMFCDRVAACRVYHPDDFTNDMPLLYLTSHQTMRLMHPETARKLIMLLEMYRDKGDEAFDEVRKALKESR